MWSRRSNQSQAAGLSTSLYSYVYMLTGVTREMLEELHRAADCTSHPARG